MTLTTQQPFFNVRSPTEDTSAEEDNTVSTASLCMSPPVTTEVRPDAPLCSSTPYAREQPHLTNGHDHVDSAATDDVVNGNVNVHITCESTNSMDVLSGGESDAGDTLSRRNNNSIASSVLGTLKESSASMGRRRNGDITYFVAKELLMTERTYKRDLELVTVSWSQQVSALSSSLADAEVVGTLARICLALEPLALPAGALLARLERTLAAATADNEEPEYKKIAEILYDHLSSTADAYMSYIESAGTLVALAESVSRRSASVRAAAAALESRAPLPLAGLLLRPLHRTLHLRRLAHELYGGGVRGRAGEAAALCERLSAAACAQLPHVESHLALCQLQRDIAGYDKLLVADREFLRMGCVYKHSSKGLQQRMLFLFSDILLLCSRGGGAGGQFRALRVLPLAAITTAQHSLPHSFLINGPDDTSILLSASNEREFAAWWRDLSAAAQHATCRDIDTTLTPEHEHEAVSASSVGAGGAAHVCWHRVTSLDHTQLYTALRSQLSGYLLRKFKKSPGWQKLWVVVAGAALYFYKGWLDAAPLASLPLLGYVVCAPTAADKIDKQFVFKLQFKTHVYFFRADSLYTYNRWTEVLRTAMTDQD